MNSSQNEKFYRGEKNCRGNQNTRCMLNKFPPPENPAVCDSVGKYSTAAHATADSMIRRMGIACRITKAKIQTHSYFDTMYRAYFIILHYDQQMYNYFTNYHTATCFDIIVPSSESL